MQLAAPTAIPYPPMHSLADARIGIERALATAGVASWSPRSSTPERLADAARVAREAADVVARSTPDGPGQDLAAAVTAARAGADLLDRAGVLLRAANCAPIGDTDPYAAVSATAYAAHDQLGAAYLRAGGS